ncbi:MAG: ABC transporter ATP-binding protein, partial [Clostridia bacterium]|nr:ABC transporter ATP-binding protein [Clostridia bacterium]
MIECENLVKIYKTRDIEVLALQGLDLVVEKGEFMAMIGRSGSGKSTLLNLLGGLDSPTAGKLTVDGVDLTKITKKGLMLYKRNTVGFVWQNNARNMLPYLTAVENIMLPMNFSGTAKKRRKAEELIELVGLSKRKNNKLAELSGGEAQRVAIAIALANDPSVLLADEPTGAVDTRTSDMIFDLFRELNRSRGITIVTVTHDRRLSGKVDRVVNIRDGKTSSEFIRNISYARELEAMQQAANVERSEKTHTEMLVLDRAGRLQLPAEFISDLKLSTPGRVIADIEGEKIVLT